jgi:hypothetical protein
VNDFQREVMQQIKAGIDRARHEGVIVEYPRGALIDGNWVPWPFDRAEMETRSELSEVSK